MRILLFNLVYFIFLWSSFNPSTAAPVESDSDDLPSEVVDYTGWRVVKVEGFLRSDNVLEAEDLRMELEEDERVNVLQDHRQDGFFHMAVSGDAIEDITSSLQEKGLSVQDLNVDLAGLISSIGTQRSSISSGEVTFSEYMNLKQIEDYLKSLAQKSPYVTLRTMGSTFLHRNIYMLKISKPSRQSRGMDTLGSGVVIHWKDITFGELDRLDADGNFKSGKKVKNNDDDTIEFTDYNLNSAISIEVVKKIIQSDLSNDFSLGTPENFINSVDMFSSTLRNEERTAKSLILQEDLILPESYARNNSIVQAISDAIIIVANRVSNTTTNSENELNRILDSIRENSVIKDIEKDQTSSRRQLWTVMENVSNLLKIIVNERINSIQLRAVGEKPAILIDGGVHAREWISPAFLLYTIKSLVEDNTSLTRDIDWYIVPVLNPDGYDYSWTNDRLWRKNRAFNDGSRCRGVDLNRNYAHKFAVSGSSSRKCSSIFHGEKGFSEPETRAIRDIIQEQKHRLKGYISVHSYGQMILYPWAYTTRSHKRRSELDNMGNGMAKAMKAVNGKLFVVGSASNILYRASGGSDDYAISQNVSYSYTFELRDTGDYGFTLPARHILPAVKESFEGVRYLATEILKNYGQRSAAPYQVRNTLPNPDLLKSKTRPNVKLGGPFNN